MKTHTIELPELLVQFVEEQIASGDYGDAESVIVASLLRAKAEADAEAVKMERFMAKVQVGIDQLDRGEGIEITDLKAYFDQIEAELDEEFAELEATAERAA